jgi:Swt1-like HEPN
MKSDHLFKLFGHNNIFLEAEIRRVEQDLNVDFGHRQDTEEEDKTYFPQFSQRLRDEAARMARHYIIFYCLENYIRELITARLLDLHGPDWWNVAVNETVRENAKKNFEREKKTGITPRSDQMIDYSNFGELGQIIRANWETFGDMFRDKGAIERILASLNMLRGPIAHCKPLADDEVLRLVLGMRDWFRQMS